MSDTIHEQIFKNLKENISIDTKQVIADGLVLDNKNEIVRSSKELVKSIARGDFDRLTAHKPDKSTVLAIYQNFPIALTEIDPVDFEGDDPLIIDELLQTAVNYIIEDLKNDKIPKLTIKK